MPPVEVAAARWPSHVERDRAHGAELLVFVERGGWGRGHRRAFVVGHHAARVAHAKELLAACVGREEGRLHHLQPMLARKGLRARAGQQHMGAVFEHRARGTHRAADVAHAGYGAGGERGAVHHGGVELVGFVVREHRAVAGVEERALLEQLHSEAGGVERAGALQQHRLRGGHDAAERVVVGLRLLGAGRGGADGAGAAVDGDHGHVARARRVG
jgi:hypothetical protein